MKIFTKISKPNSRFPGPAYSPRVLKILVGVASYALSPALFCLTVPRLFVSVGPAMPPPAVRRPPRSPRSFFWGGAIRKKIGVLRQKSPNLAFYSGVADRWPQLFNFDGAGVPNLLKFPEQTLSGRATTRKWSYFTEAADLSARSGKEKERPPTRQNVLSRGSTAPCLQ